MVYNIVSPGESVLGGKARLHINQDGIPSWQYAVAWHAIFVSRDEAQRVADMLPECKDWQGQPIGRPVVLEDPADEWRGSKGSYPYAPSDGVELRPNANI
jgi:hypothetical protein